MSSKKSAQTGKPTTGKPTTGKPTTGKPTKVVPIERNGTKNPFGRRWTSAAGFIGEVMYEMTEPQTAGWILTEVNIRARKNGYGERTTVSNQLDSMNIEGATMPDGSRAPLAERIGNKWRLTEYGRKLWSLGGSGDRKTLRDGQTLDQRRSVRNGDAGTIAVEPKPAAKKQSAKRKAK